MINSSSLKQHKEQRTLMFFLMGVLVISCISILMFYNLYKVSRNNLISMWNNNAITMSKDVEYCLNTPKDAIIFTSTQIEQMLAQGESVESINQYLINESSVYSNIIESNSTGIYGYCNGQYLDGSGWIPPEDYAPTTRPWYTSAIEANGEIAFEKPFLNLQTETMMMSVSIMLSDNESVISMDIFLDSIQKLEEQMKAEENIDAAMVLDKSGVVVSHSDPSQVGLNYLTAGSDLQKKLVSSVFAIEQGTFTLESVNGRDIIFCDQINNEWCSVLILNEKTLFKSITYIYALSAISLIILLLIFTSIFLIFFRKQKEVAELESDINAIADIYTSIDLLDLKNNKAKSLRQSVINEHFNNHNKHEAQIRNVDDSLVSVLAAEASRNLLAQFMDINTFADRLKDINSISHEYLDNDNKWNRMQVIAIERDNDGTINKVLCTIQSIDVDKRQQERLRKMAETDGLTGILNRSGGEAKLLQYIEAKKNGLFLILDADNFKHVNDVYGHDKGDEVIKILADCLSETFRDTDIVYRLGGDEFGIFALGVENLDIASLVIKRLFTNIEETKLPNITDWELHISVGGIFCNSNENISFSSIYKKADEAMYKSKQSEGNKFTLALK